MQFTRWTIGTMMRSGLVATAAVTLSALSLFASSPAPALAASLPAGNARSIQSGAFESSANTPVVASPSLSCQSYTVQPGDTLGTLAGRFGTSVGALAAANGIGNVNLIFVGQQLSTCGGGSAPATTTLTSAPSGGSCQSYTVQPGDTLGVIAGRFGTSVGALASANGIGNVNLIFVGQHLSTCGGTGASAPAQAAQVVQTSTQGYALGGEPCQSTDFGSPGMWKIPAGCFGGVYSVNPGNYVSRGSYGWCTWWVSVLHPNNPGIFNGPRSSYPVAGAAMYFAPGEQGASPEGHWANVVAVLGNGWVLVSEMNNSWRGGFALVSYRYAMITGGTSFINAGL